MAATDLPLRHDPDASERAGPAGMLCRVLVLLAAIVPMAALALAWRRA